MKELLGIIVLVLMLGVPLTVIIYFLLKLYIDD